MDEGAPMAPSLVPAPSFIDQSRPGSSASFADLDRPELDRRV